MTIFPLDNFKELKTPFYYYDLELLKKTLSEVNSASDYPGFKVHYAIKANANPLLLSIIKEAGLGIDAVSGGEIRAALEQGFNPAKIVYAGVGKSDEEITLALENEISCLNVESFAELSIIEEIAKSLNKIAPISIRINPNIDAHTHKYITTGLEENKFGIAPDSLEQMITFCSMSDNLDFKGVHFHIGSQILDTKPFELLCNFINRLQESYKQKGIIFRSINVGGGLGIDYENPDQHPIPDFKQYFNIFHENLKLEKGQELHFELGRSIVAQCGSLITKVLYVKEGQKKKFAIVDAGMTDLIRPALYQAHHLIQNLTSDGPEEVYDVVGPICESSDVFGTDERLNCVRRGDLIALRSAGAYGEIMASRYNLRALPGCFAK